MADYQYIIETGVIVPDTAEIQTEVENEYKSVFGQDLVTTPDTPQGVLITGEVLARDAVVRNNAALANQINPNMAGGVFLDAICALSGLQRDAATKSFVSATVTGVADTVIPEGSIARTSAGDEFETTEEVTIGVGGTATVEFQSVAFGPIPAPAGELDLIVSDVLGWETVTNPGAATLGTDTQTDQNLRTLRRVTLALQGVALPEAIISAVYNVPEVRSLSFRENITNAPIVIEGVTLAAHSIYVCVDGGTNEDIAETLLAKKSLGAAWNGDVTVEVIDPASGQEYEVQFDRPDELQIDVRATVRANNALTDVTAAVKEAILAYANGLLENEQGLIVGADVSTFELSGAINRETPQIYVQKVEIKFNGESEGAYSTDEIAIAINEVARIIEENIEVVIV